MLRTDRHQSTASQLADVAHRLLGDDARFAVRSFDGSSAGPADAAATLVVRSPDALRRIVGRPGELGFVRAYVTGDLDVVGDLFAVVEPAFSLGERPVSWGVVTGLVRLAGPSLLTRAAPPPEEVRFAGRRHSHQRDAAAVTHHYDVSNRFYWLVLGPSLTYSCALFPDGDATLEAAQAAKHELIARKLRLQPGMRLLDVGCGWGSMLLHAAGVHGVDAVGITLSEEQATLARKRISEAGLADRVQVRVQDYRDVDDGPFDAISSIGMFEHVGRAQIDAYLRRMHALLRPQGRFLNHAIGRPGEQTADTAVGHLHATSRRMLTAAGSSRPSRITSPLMQRYIFPDAELHEVGTVVSLMQDVGFEVRHLESLREHYALTLRHWVRNLEHGWDAAAREAGEARARLWRLYMAACAVAFEQGSTQVHQVLCSRADGGDSGLPLRPAY